MQFENINFKTQKDLETCGNDWAKYDMTLDKYKGELKCFKSCNRF